jgi:hypothetical protein
LFIILNIVKYDKAWAASVPLATTYLLLSTARDDTELIPIDALDDDISFLTNLEFFNFELSNDVVVFAELIGNVSQMLDRHIFAGADQDYVWFDPEQCIGKDVVVGEGSGLGMVARGGGCAGRVGAAVSGPAFSVEIRGGLGAVIPGAEEHTG